MDIILDDFKVQKLYAQFYDRHTAQSTGTRHPKLNLGNTTYGSSQQAPAVKMNEVAVSFIYMSLRVSSEFHMHVIVITF